jgi:hypothetical protein
LDHPDPIKGPEPGRQAADFLKEVPGLGDSNDGLVGFRKDPVHPAQPDNLGFGPDPGLTHPAVLEDPTDGKGDPGQVVF